MLGQVAGLRNGNDRFAPADINSLCDILRVPQLANVGTTLRRASEKSHVRPYGTGVWALTPSGDEVVRELLEETDFAEIEAALDSARVPGAELAHATHTLLPATFAPMRWAPGIARMLDEFPFDQNVFCMTRFPSSQPSDPLEQTIDVLRSVCKEHGLHLHLASDKQFEDDVLGNVGVYMWGSRYGVSIVEDRVGRGLNHNTLIELGAMVVTGRRSTILLDKSISDLPSDLAGHIYKPVDLEESQSVESAMANWVRGDLGFTPEA